MPTAIDLNCDLGEGAGHDRELMPLISSANIACGAHAGDLNSMRATVRLALKHGVAIGAHPGFADRENFGRRELAIAPAAAGEMVFKQVRALQAVAVEFGVVVRHVKLHGALYNMASRDRELAEAMVQAVCAAEETPMLYVLAGSELERAARAQGSVVVVPEVFADRTYEPDGSLTPRGRVGAVITGVDAAVAQVLSMVRDGVVPAVDGTLVPIRAETVCLHGDTPHAVRFAQVVRNKLAAAGIAVRSPAAVA